MGDFGGAGGGVFWGNVSVGGTTSLTINPGVYTQISVTGTGKLTLNPGIYVIAGGGFTVSGNAVVNGSGVLIYNAGSAFPNAGGTFGPLALGGNSTVILTPPATGAYAGIDIFQSRDNTLPLSLWVTPCLARAARCMHLRQRLG
jgi:hypothetical protein